MDTHSSVDHELCAVYEPCSIGGVCPREPARQARLRQQAGGWSALVPRAEDGGCRHYLDGKAVHCGELLELQEIGERTDDYGSFTVPLQRGALVRYEARFVGAEPEVTLYATVAGRTFATAGTAGMRFRWPRA
jgi:hypothetical protein